MTRSGTNRARPGLAALALAAATLLAACGQGSSSTSVVLTGPPDKVEALIAQHKLLAAPVQSHVETLPDGRERATFNKAKGMPAGELLDLGKAAAKAGVSFEFSTTRQSGVSIGSAGDPQKSPPARTGGPVV
ncbi:hypothetical protein [Caulobacter sp. Root1455]|uniref:hypothetical protein n=1 Tax=Caulobacter sp. Root1455 TaxID=1736465 RepID=UPI0012E3B444|nr:hypothetical protein [Caulobacter sp. Root1455]